MRVVETYRKICLLGFHPDSWVDDGAIPRGRSTEGQKAGLEKRVPSLASVPSSVR